MVGICPGAYVRGVSVLEPVGLYLDNISRSHANSSTEMSTGNRSKGLPKTPWRRYITAELSDYGGSSSDGLRHGNNCLIFSFC